MISFGAGSGRFALPSVPARFPEPSGPVLTVPELQYHCGVSSSSTAVACGAVQDIHQQLCPFPWPRALSTWPSQSGHTSPRGGRGAAALQDKPAPVAAGAARPSKAQSWRGGRAKATLASGALSGRGAASSSDH